MTAADDAAGGPNEGPDDRRNESPLTWHDHVAYLRDTFINDLVRRGLRLVTSRSEVPASDTTLRDDRVTVTLDDGFPYSPPKVRTEVPGPRSWHQDPGGVMCLYTGADHDGLPWLDADAFLARIEEWFIKNDAGWPEDPPALDLEAYLNLPVDHRFVLYADLNRHVDGYVQLREEHSVVRVIGAGRVPKNSTKALLSGYVADIGEVDQPPLDWDDLIENVTEADRIRGAIGRGRVDVLLVQYHRRNRQAQGGTSGAHRGIQHGVLAVTFPRLASRKAARGKPGTREPVGPGARRPHLAFSGAADDAAMRLRSGTTAAALADKNVYLVGAGALGSHIADGLSRAGLGRLTIRDHDILKPGNMTRHLVTSLALVGVGKAQAVQVVLNQRAYNRTLITPDGRALHNPAEAAALLADYDLVVDATADGSVTHLLEDAAAHTVSRFVTTCLQNDGRSMRIDVVPPFEGASPLPATTVRPTTAPETFEAGCGEPISPTPPHAVAEAAAMAVRHIIGILTGTPLTPAGEHRETS